MEVNIVTQTTFELEAKNRQLFNQILDKTVEVLQINKPYLLSVIFVNTEQIHEINLQYRNIDRPTDVISFALMDSEDMYYSEEQEIELGDIFISIDAVHEQAQRFQHSFDRELSFLFLHGVLHLLGYDHMNEQDEAQMNKLQDEIIDEIIAK